MASAAVPEVTAGRILVTGAGGFIGRRTLAPLTRLGFEVHAVTRRSPEVPVTEIHTTDLLDTTAVEALVTKVRPSHVLHLAWYAEHGLFWEAPQNADWVHATCALARAAANHGATRFVGVGTCAEYDWSDGGSKLRLESDNIAPTTRYGQAKARAHKLAGDLFGSGDFVWARLFHLFGSDEPQAKLVASVIADVLAGRMPGLKAAGAVRDYMAVEDAGVALAQLAAGSITGAVNVASGEATTIGAIAAMIAQSLGRTDLAPQLGEPGDPPIMLADVSRLRLEAAVAAPSTLRALLARCCQDTRVAN